MKRIISILTISLLIASTLQAQYRKRVAVFVFQDKSDRSVSWYDGKGVGDGMSDMLTTDLVKSGKYRVIERAEIDRIMNEQRFGQSGAVTAESAAKVGQLLGVEFAVIGAVTEFGKKDGNNDVGIRGVGLGLRQQGAVCAIDVRLVNTSTGEIIAAETIRKEKNKTGLSVSTNEFRFNNRDGFDQSVIGKAVRECIDGVMKLLEKSEAKVQWQAKVITVQGSDIFINSGANDGLASGKHFAIFKKGQALIDPDTGISLGSVDSQIGELEIVDPSIGGGKASKCRLVSGSGGEKGSIVRPK
jgi:curli biogenesis system outer membrane secretion channel CsgG